MTAVDVVSQKRRSIADDAYTKCLKACEAFDDFLGVDREHRSDQVWWKCTFEEHPEELAQRIRMHLMATTLTDTGCLETEAPLKKVEPQRVYWRGRRQKVYQLVAWGLHGDLPSKRSVVRHRCNNRRCINPEHLKVGTQAQNLRDQKFSRINDWPHP